MTRALSPLSMSYYDYSINEEMANLSGFEREVRAELAAVTPGSVTSVASSVTLGRSYAGRQGDPPAADEETASPLRVPDETPSDEVSSLASVSFREAPSDEAGGWTRVMPEHHKRKGDPAPLAKNPY